MENWTTSKIREARKAHRLSQEDVAREAGLSDRSHLSRIETGVFDPKLSTVNRILDAIDDSGASKRTLVVFASDHGAPKPGSNTPFTGRKGGLFEGGIRAPCILRWPGHVKPRVVSGQTAITMDLTTSFLRIAGAQTPADWRTDGIDLVRRIEKQQPPMLRTLFWRARRGKRTWPVGE